jgi:hypothetical protein
MFCETERELELLGKLQRQFPESNNYLLELVAWVYLNKPEEFERIMAEHDSSSDLVDITQLSLAIQSPQEKPQVG